MIAAAGIDDWHPIALERSRAGDRTASLVFLHVNLFSVICLQRFCIYVGDSPIYVCLPVFLGSLLWLLASGRARFRSLTTALFTAVVVVALLSTLLAVDQPDPRISSLSVFSVFSLLAVYLGFVVEPTERFDASRTFRIFVGYVRLCAVLGIAQYFAQFAGVRLFSFMIAFPALKPFLVEPLFNFWPVVAYGSPILRSNGFFLVEPSVFSQVLMLAVIVDVFVRRNWWWLPLYGVAYLLTYAGTGLLALIIAFVLSALLAPRQSGRVLLFGIAAVFLAAVGSVAFPDQFASLTGRANEISYSGSSGYARYMTQFDVLSAIWGETRLLIGFGPGALERASFYTAGGGNPLLKLTVEYGIVGMLSFAAFYVAALWRRPIALVSLFMLVNFQLGGGYLMFVPLVVLSAIVCIWSVAPETERATARFIDG